MKGKSDAERAAESAMSQLLLKRKRALQATRIEATAFLNTLDDQLTKLERDLNQPTLLGKRPQHRR